MGMAMIWLRSALYAVWFWGTLLVMASFGQLLPRAWLTVYARAWARITLSGLWLAGVRVEITGREHLPTSGPVLIASQHQSEFDTVIWLGVLPRCRYVVKTELLRLPLFGRLVRRSGQIAVDRAGGAATLRQLLRDGAAALAAGRQLVIFPEGTRVPIGQTVPLQPGVAALAAYTGIAVVPVATDSGRSWPGKSFLKRPGVIRIEICRPLPAGLGRAALLAGLDEAYRRSQVHSNVIPVDNSVGSQITRLS
jgi:1-acyl-sn-glycerol-3-phosphate acyltransferase